MELRTPNPPPPLLSDLSISPSFPSPPRTNSTSTSTNQDEKQNQIQKQEQNQIIYSKYKGELEIPSIMNLVDTQLSEPYNFYTYRYFLSDWPNLCFMAYNGPTPIGTILCKQEVHRGKLNRGYLAMLSVQEGFRGEGVATNLVKLAISEMLLQGVQEIILETETDNTVALKFYKKLGFLKEKRMFRFYLNGKDAFRLALVVPVLGRG